jgi:hypothetical protein
VRVGGSKLQDRGSAAAIVFKDARYLWMALLVEVRQIDKYILGLEGMKAWVEVERR